MKSREEVIWAAGLFEGEGCFTFGHSPVATLTMCDEDIVRRFQEAIGVGKVYGPYYANNKDWKPYWRWQVFTYNDVQAVAGILWKWLGPRRRAAASKTLAKKPARRPKQPKKVRV